ncbi:P-selectin glycoprotein ligand 1 [Fundulus heteroclitus]|uniref:P-selectin glycoprotein ligand 1 n=1 Tax=Fundulus heteroclitus TaxID=8078 RepID=UPI00165C5256|nr:P-selectin glycoprotein ligand 1 [Fundulus heteroclitus]
MTPRGMTKRTPLLWGMCLLLAANPAVSSAPENSNTSVTVPTEVATNQQAATSASVLQPTALHPAKPSDAAARAEEAATPTAAHEDGVRNKTSDRRLAVTTATSGSKPLAPTEKVTTKDVVPVELTAAAAERNGTAVLASTGEPQPLSPTLPARTRSPTVSIAPTAKERLVSSSKTTGHAQTFTEVTSAGSGQRSSTAMTAATSETQPRDRTTTANAANQTTGLLLHSSASSRTDTTSPPTTSAGSHASTQQPTSVTGIRSEEPTTHATNESTQSAATSSGSTASVTTSAVVQSTTSELTSTSRSAPASTGSNPTSTGPASTSTYTDSSNTTTANSTSPAGVLIPRGPASTTTRVPSTTVAPCGPSNGSASSQILPCSTKGVVKQCLVVIAVLALVATVFVISTIVLCIKLSARKYKGRKPPPATEMMCISSLLPDKSPAYTRQRNPVSNGVLVFPLGGDSDEEGGDNLTLSSFLPENDRYV